MTMANLYVSLAADIIAALMMIWQLSHIHELSGEKEKARQYFRCFSVVILLMCFFHILKTLGDIEQGGVTYNDIHNLTDLRESAWYWTEMAALFIDMFLSTVFLCMWISFLCWFLFKDRDFIRRKFWMGFTPLIVSATVSIFSIPMSVMSEMGFKFFILSLIVAFLVRAFSFIITLRLLHSYKKQNGYLRFFNPWAFFIPVALGWCIQDLVGFGMGSLGSAIGVVLLFVSIVGEERYMDPETRFYKKDFVQYLKKLVEKDKYAPCSAMTFTLSSSEGMKDFAGILKKELPDNCEPIIKSDHEVVVLTNVSEKGPLMMVTGDVEAASEVKGSCTLKKKKETTEEFMERVL